MASRAEPDIETTHQLKKQNSVISIHPPGYNTIISILVNALFSFHKFWEFLLKLLIHKLLVSSTQYTLLLHYYNNSDKKKTKFSFSSFFGTLKSILRVKLWSLEPFYLYIRIAE